MSLLQSLQVKSQTNKKNDGTSCLEKYAEEMEKRSKAIELVDETSKKASEKGMLD